MVNFFKWIMEAAEFKQLFKVVHLGKRGNDKIMEVAYHEAGHVLINLIYELPGTRTTIIPDERKNSAGSNEHLWNESRDYDFYDYICDMDGWDTERQIEYLIITQMAGIMGEAFYSGRYNWEGAENDFNQILDVFLSYGINDIPDLQPYWNKTFDLINRNKNILGKIANDLYKSKTLNAEYFKKEFRERFKNFES
jgi:hypothetical protein